MSAFLAMSAALIGPFEFLLGSGPFPQMAANEIPCCPFRNQRKNKRRLERGPFYKGGPTYKHWTNVKRKEPA